MRFSSTSTLLAAACAWTMMEQSCQVLGAPLEDLVESLPDYGRPPTPHFSGYLDGTPGCDTESNGPYCKLHYWLALAEEDSYSDYDFDKIDSVNLSKKPVVLWLNGGPGSSSILGFLQENGPLLMTANGGLMENPWSWTKVAHVMALEAPVGVGYSYCANQVDGKVCKNTDKYTASTSRAALQDFFHTKFPELATADFFITGESYAGVYIPTLTKELLDHAPDIRLKGIAVGDPCTDNTAQADSMDALWYGHKNGLVDDAVFDLLWNTCMARSPTLMMRGGKHLVAAHLNQHLLSIQQEQVNLKDYATHMLASLATHAGPAFVKSDECTLAFRKFLMSSSRALSQGWSDLYIDDYSLFAPVSSKEDEDMSAYMERPDVRAALHVSEAPTKGWYGADVGFDYTKEYDACNQRAAPDALSMIDFYKEIIPKLDITWIYNGDTDPCVSYEGTRTAVKRIGLSELDGGSYRPWFYNQTATTLDVLATKAPLFGPNLLVQDMGIQFAGEVVNYEQGLAFVTIHGSGHMVPQFRPQAALHMIDRFVTFGDLAPLLPTNETLTQMDNAEFKEFMNQWTDSAKAPAYVEDLNLPKTTTTTSQEDEAGVVTTAEDASSTANKESHK